MAEVLTPGYSSITIYLDSVLLDKLYLAGRLKTSISHSEIPIKPRTYVHVHDHGKRHAKVYIQSLVNCADGQVEVELVFVMNLTVGI